MRGKMRGKICCWDRGFFIAGRDFGFGERIGSGKKAKASVEFFSKIAFFGGRV
jgi:hypothetical protein